MSLATRLSTLPILVFASPSTAQMTEEMMREVEQIVFDQYVCVLRQIIKRSPNHYLIAFVERSDAETCTAGKCFESLKIVKVLASKAPEGVDFPTSITVSSNRRGMPEEMYKSGGELGPGTKEFVILLPEPETGGYYAKSRHAPISAKVEESETRAVHLAVDESPSAPVCESPPN